MKRRRQQRHPHHFWSSLFIGRRNYRAACRAVGKAFLKRCGGGRFYANKPALVPLAPPWRGRTAWFIFVALLTLGVAGSVAAQQQVLQLELQDIAEEQRAEGWFLNLRQWLGAKVVRPAAGTVLTVQSSAYASSPRQTDSTPCITAAGTRVRPGVVATNFLPLGTLVKINGELHIVEDRMNPRYAGRYMDIWFPSTSQALEFGRKNMTIEIVGYGKPGQELTTDKEQAMVPSTLKRAQARFTAFTRTLSAALLTKVNPNVNRFDVDCTKPGAGA